MNTKNGPTRKKSLMLCDASRAEVELTTWGDQADFLESVHTHLISQGVVGLKFATVRKDER